MTASLLRRCAGGAAALALILSGCGYHFVGSSSPFAGELHTIGIETFANETREIGIEKRLALAIEREFIARGPLRVAPTPAEGDLVLTGTVRTVEDRPVAFNREDEVLIYQTVLALDVELRRRDNGEVVWKTRGLQGVHDYESVASVVVATSAEFRSGTLNAEDLGAFTDIQLAESRRRQALERIIGGLARDVYESVMEDF